MTRSSKFELVAIFAWIFMSFVCVFDIACLCFYNNYFAILTVPAAFYVFRFLNLIVKCSIRLDMCKDLEFLDIIETCDQDSEKFWDWYYYERYGKTNPRQQSP